MLKQILTSTVLAGTLALAGTAAANADSYTVIERTPSVTNAGYECGPYGCDYLPNRAYIAPAPGYVTASPYAAPVAPDCHWKQGILGNWKQKC